MLTDDSTTPTAKYLYFFSEHLDSEKLTELEEKFFSSIKLKNGTYKLTYRNRLDDLNDFVNELLPPFRPLKIMDVAVSSGITTAEWISSLERGGIECQMVAGDSVANAFLISVGKNFHALVDSTGHQLQLDIWGRAISTPIGGQNLMLYLLPILLIKTVSLLLFPKLRRACSENKTARQVSFCGITCRRLELVSPSLKKHADVAIIEDDILVNKSFKRCFHVVRAANILHRSYFSDSVLSAMVVNLRDRLMANGLLIICRTNDCGVNNGTVFVLTESGKLEVLARLNDGDEIEDLVLGLAPY